MSELLRSAEELTTIASGFGPKKTVDRLETEIRAPGMTVFARIDLPLKALVWQNAANRTWLSYNEPNWIAQRHGGADAEPVVRQP
jgi:uncharacterized protein (DUF302 family)